MKKIFYAGLTGLLLFEIANVYFIMPMPGSQRMNSIDVAYFLYRWRWIFRGLFALLIVIGLLKATWKRKWTLALPLLLLGAVIYMANFVMAADAMFKQPKQLLMAAQGANKVDSNRLVIGVNINGESKAYPVQFLRYHHQVQDVVGGKPVLVTYCTVCRTGRVFEPFVNGKKETFRLVGMDHFNAMLEDATTKSWWRQATGQAIAGTLKGLQLREVLSTQTSLATWLQLNPGSFIMQADPAFEKQYDSTFKYESGKSKSQLTGTDSISWKDKSWVIGIKDAGAKKAYDWNLLKKLRVINDTLNNKNIILLLAKDDKSFFAFENPGISATAILKNDTLIVAGHRYLINGKGIDTPGNLKPLPAYQEFWHSWKAFNITTLKY